MELHDPEESMVIRKILAHDIRMKKNPQTKDETFWINADVESHDAEESMAIRTILAHDIRMRAESPTCTEISSMVLLTLKLSICCYVFKYFVFTDLKKNTLILAENLLNFNGTYMGQEQPFESFLKNGCSE